MSYGERLSQWASLIESPKYRARRDIWDPVKWKWDIGMLAGEMGMPNKLKEILPKEPSPDGFIGPEGISMDAEFGWTGQSGGSYFDLKDRLVENFKYEVSPENIGLFTGAQHSNFCAILASISSGDKVVLARPSWMQWEPLCQAFGAKVKILPLREELGWKWDMEELKEAVGRNTKMVLLCNPNNPTGRLYDLKEQKAIVDIAQDSNAIILSDESFRGLEIDAPSMSSIPFVNLYYNAVSTASMSKPFTADGIRVGWAATQNSNLLRLLNSIQSISVEHVGGLSVILAWAANEPATFKKIVKKHQKDAIEKRKVLTDWMKKQSFFTTWNKPQCGFLSFPGWDYDISSIEFLNSAWDYKKLAFMAGNRYGVEKHIRLGSGRKTMAGFKKGLSILSGFLEKFE